MEPISAFLLTATGYILKGAAQSKAAEKAKEEILEKFWKWIKPYFIKEVPKIEEADNPEAETKTQAHLLELIKKETFMEELTQQITKLQQAGIKEKNIVKKDIEQVKKIKIGDKEYSPNEFYNCKNIVEGSVKDAEEFTLGDGH